MNPRSLVWAFEDAPETACFSLRRILQGRSEILLVTHDQGDGSWQFLDGRLANEEDAALVGLGEMIEFDPTLGELADLPRGWIGTRSSKGEEWRRSRGRAGE